MPQPQSFPNNPLLNPNLQNGLPSEQRQSPVKLSSTIPSSQLPTRKPFVSSNGLQHSSSHSSRDSSPLQWKHQIPASQLPPGMSSQSSHNPQPPSGPSRNIPQKTSGNLLLTQAQESTNQNILLGPNMNMFNPNSPSLVTSSPRQIVQLVGPSVATNPSSENTTATQASSKNTGNHNVESLPQSSQNSAKPQQLSQNIFPPQPTGETANLLPPNSRNKSPQLVQNVFPSQTTAQTIKLQPVPLNLDRQSLSGEQFPQRTSTPQQIVQPTVTRQLPPKQSNGEAQNTSVEQSVQNVVLDQQNKPPIQNVTGPPMFGPRETNLSDAGQNDSSQFPPNYLHQQKNFTLNSNTNSTNSLNTSISSAFASSSQFNNTSHKLNQQPQNTFSPNIPVSSQDVKYPNLNQNANTQQQSVASMPPKQVNQFSQQFVSPNPTVSPQFNLTATQKQQQPSPNIQPPGFNQNRPNLMQQNQPNLIQQNQPNLMQPNQPNVMQPNQPNLMQQNQPNLMHQNQPNLIQQNQVSQAGYPNQQFQYPNVSQPLQPKPLNQFNGPPNKSNSPQLPPQHPGYPPTSNYLPPQNQQIGPPKGPLGTDLSAASPYSPAQHSPLTRKYPTPTAGYPNQNLRQQNFTSAPTSFMPNQNSNVLPPQPNYPVQPLSGPTQTNYPYSTNSPASPGGNYMNINQQFNNMNITQTGFNRMWGAENIDLLQHRNVLPPEKVEPPKIRLLQECMDAANCHPDIFRCTLTKVPDTSSLLNKSRLPLGVLIHPFRDLNHLPVIQCSTIVRCRACRTYINPFVYFVDTKRWKCNLCFRVNELPEEFQYDPVSKSYGDPSRRPEIKSSTIEYIAPSEYMLRPPQPAVYLFVLDVSQMAVESGYLRVLCDTLIDELENLPGDSRTQIGFICFNSALRFYSLADGLSQPHEMIVVDIEDVFLPCPDNLLVNLRERKEMVKDLLVQLPNRFINSHDNGSALGAALQVAFKMMSPTGGRVSVFQCILPTVGPGALTSREVPTQRSSAEVAHLNPATDFYKRLALDCSAQQIAVDLFVLNSQYVDLSTISGISKFSGGCIHHYPLFKASRQIQCQQFDSCLRRYLTRKIGYEAVMRIRCTRGLSIHTFHGNFFVRSTDLLSLPNCNPDAGFGMQVSIEENLTDLQTVCFQAALLYTSSKGERRIRVHTLCLPIATNLSEILNSADQQCIVGLLAKMAVDRSLSSSLTDARDAFINVVTDVLSAYKLALNQGSGSGGGLLAPHTLRLLPMYISALLKYVAFRTGQNTRLDDRVFAMCEMKTLPLGQLIQAIYPDLYPIHCLTEEGGLPTEDGRIIPQPGRLQLSAEKLDSRGAYLLDCGHHMVVYIGHNVNPHFINNALGFQHFTAIPEELLEFPKIETPENELLHLFVGNLNEEKPFSATIQIVRDDSPQRVLFTEKLIEDRIENALSYYEFLQHLKAHVK